MSLKERLKLAFSGGENISESENTKRNITFFVMVFAIFLFNFGLFLSVHGGDIKAGFKNLISVFAGSPEISQETTNVSGNEIDDFYISKEISCNGNEEEFIFDQNPNEVVSGSCAVWTTTPNSTVTFDSDRAKSNTTIWESIVDFMRNLTGAAVTDKSINSNVRYALSASTMKVYDVLGWTSEWTPLGIYESFFTTTSISRGSAIEEDSYRWNTTENSVANTLYRLFEYVPNWVPDGTPASYVLQGTSLNNGVDYGSTIYAQVDNNAYNRYYQVRPYVTFEESGMSVYSSLTQDDFNNIAATATSFYKKNSSDARSIYSLMRETQEYFLQVSGGGELLSTYYNDNSISQDGNGKYIVSGISSLSGKKFDTIEEARTAMIEANRVGATRSFLYGGRYYIYCAGDDEYHLPHFKQFSSQPNGRYQWQNWDGTNNAGNGSAIFDYYYGENSNLYVALTNAEIQQQSYYWESIKETYNSYNITNGFAGSVALNAAGNTLNNDSANVYVWEDWYKYNIVYDKYEAQFYTNYTIANTSFEASKPGDTDNLIYVKTSNVALFAMNFYNVTYGTTSYSTSLINPGYTNLIININDTSNVSKVTNSSLNKIKSLTTYLTWDIDDSSYTATSSFNNLKNLLSANITNSGLYDSNAVYSGQNHLGNTYFNLTNSNYYVYQVVVPWIYTGISDHQNNWTDFSHSGGTPLSVWGNSNGKIKYTQNTGSGNTFTINPNGANHSLTDIFYIDQSELQDALDAIADAKGYNVFLNSFTSGGNTYYVYKSSSTGETIYLRGDREYLTELEFEITLWKWNNSSSSYYCLNSSGNYISASSSCNFGTTSPDTTTSYGSVSSPSSYVLAAYQGVSTSSALRAQYLTGWSNFTSISDYSNFTVKVLSGETYGSSLNLNSSSTFYASSSAAGSGKFIIFPGDRYNFKTGGYCYTLVGIKYADNSNYYYYRYIRDSNFITSATVGGYVNKLYSCYGIHYYKLKIKSCRTGSYNWGWTGPDVDNGEVRYLYCRGDELFSALGSDDISRKTTINPWYATESELNSGVWENSHFKMTTTNTGNKDIYIQFCNGNPGSQQNEGCWYWFLMEAPTLSDYVYAPKSWSVAGYRVDYNRTATYHDYWWSTYKAYTSNSSIYSMTAFTSNYSYTSGTESGRRIMYANGVSGDCCYYGLRRGGTGSSGNAYEKLWYDTSKTYTKYIYGNTACEELYTDAYGSVASWYVYGTNTVGGPSSMALNGSGYNSYSKDVSGSYRTRTIYFSTSGTTRSTSARPCGATTGSDNPSTLYGTGSTTMYSQYYIHDFSGSSPSYSQYTDHLGRTHADFVNSSYHYNSSYGIFTGKVAKLYYLRKSSFYEDDETTLTIRAKYYGSQFIGLSSSVSGTDSYSLVNNTQLEYIAKSIFNSNLDSYSYSHSDTNIFIKKSYLAYYYSLYGDWGDVVDNISTYYCKYKYDANGSSPFTGSNFQVEVPGAESIFRPNLAPITAGGSVQSNSVQNNRQKLAALSKLNSNATYSYLTINLIDQWRTDDSIYKIRAYDASYKISYASAAPSISGDPSAQIIQDYDTFKVVTTTTGTGATVGQQTSITSIGGKDYAQVFLCKTFTAGGYYLGKLGNSYSTSNKNYYRLEMSDAFAPSSTTFKNSSSTWEFIIKGSGRNGIIQNIEKMYLTTATTDNGDLSDSALANWYRYDGSSIYISAPNGENYSANNSGITSAQTNNLKIKGKEPTVTETYYKNSSNKVTVYGIANTPVTKGSTVTKYFLGNPTESAYAINYKNGTLTQNNSVNATFYLPGSFETIPSSLTASNSSFDGASAQTYNSQTSDGKTYNSIATEGNNLDICSQSEILAFNTNCLLGNDASVISNSVSYSGISVSKYLYVSYHRPLTNFSNWVSRGSVSVSYENSNYTSAYADAQLGEKVVSSSKITNNQYDYDGIVYVYVRKENESTKQRYYTLLTKVSNNVTTLTWYKDGLLADEWNPSTNSYSNSYRRSEIANNNLFDLDSWISGLLFNSNGTYVKSNKRNPNVYITTNSSNETKYRINFNQSETLEADVTGLTPNTTYTLSIKGTASGTISVGFGSPSNKKSIPTTNARTSVTFTATSSSTKIYFTGGAGSYLDINWITVEAGDRFTYYVPYSTTSIKSNINYTFNYYTGEKYRKYDNVDPFINMMYLSKDGNSYATQVDVYDIEYSAYNLENHPTTFEIGGERISATNLSARLQDSAYASVLVQTIKNSENRFVAIAGDVGKNGTTYTFTVIEDGKQVQYKLVPTKDTSNRNIVEYGMIQYSMNAYLEVIGYGSNAYEYFDKSTRGDNPPDSFSFEFTNPMTGETATMLFRDLILYSPYYESEKTYLDNPNYNYKEIISFINGNLYIADASLSSGRMQTVEGYPGVKVNGVQTNSYASVLTKTSKILDTESEISDYMKIQRYIDANYHNGTFYNREDCWRDITNSDSALSEILGTLHSANGESINYYSDWKAVGYAYLEGGCLDTDNSGYLYINGDSNGEISHISTYNAARNYERVIYTFDGSILKLKNVLSSETLSEFAFSHPYYLDGSTYKELTIDSIRSGKATRIYEKTELGNYVLVLTSVNSGANRTYFLNQMPTNLYSDKELVQTITSAAGVTTTFTLPNSKFALRSTTDEYIYSTTAEEESNKGYWESNESTLFYAANPGDKYGNSWMPNSETGLQANCVFLELTDSYALVYPNHGVRLYKKDLSDFSDMDVTSGANQNYYDVNSDVYKKIINSNTFKYGMAATDLNGSSTPLLYPMQANDKSIFENGKGYAVSDKALNLYYIVFKTPAGSEEEYKSMYYWGTSDKLLAHWETWLQKEGYSYYYTDSTGKGSYLEGYVPYEAIKLELRSTMIDENGNQVNFFENRAIVYDNEGKEVSIELNVLFKSSKENLYKYNLVSNSSNYIIANVLDYYTNKNGDVNGASGLYSLIEGENGAKSEVNSVTDASGFDNAVGFNSQQVYLGCGSYSVRTISGVAAAIVLTPKNTVLIASNTIYNKLVSNFKNVRNGKLSSNVDNVFGDIAVTNGAVSYYTSKFQSGLNEYYLISGLTKKDGETRLSSDAWDKYGGSGANVREEIPEYLLINNGTTNFTYTYYKRPTSTDGWSGLASVIDNKGGASTQTNVTEFSYSTAYLYAFFSSDEPDNVFFYQERMKDLFRKITVLYNAVNNARGGQVSLNDFIVNIANYANIAGAKNAVGKDTWLLTTDGIVQVLNSSYISWEFDSANHELRYSTDFARGSLDFVIDASMVFDMFTGDTNYIDYGDYSYKVELNSAGEYVYKIYLNARKGQTQSSLIDFAIEDSKYPYEDDNFLAIMYVVKKNNMKYVYIEIQDTDYIQSDGSRFYLDDLVNGVNYQRYSSFFETDGSCDRNSDWVPEGSEGGTNVRDNGLYKDLLETTYKEAHDNDWWKLWYNDSTRERAREIGASKLFTDHVGEDFVSVTHALNYTLPLVSTRDRNKQHYLFDNLLYNGDMGLEVQLFGSDTTSSWSSGFNSGYYFEYFFTSTNANDNNWKNYWFYRSTLAFTEPTMYVKGTTAWNNKYTIPEKRAITVTKASVVYPTSMVSLIGSWQIERAKNAGYDWYYSRYAGFTRMTMAHSTANQTTIGKDSDLYVLFAFDTSEITLNFAGNTTVNNGTNYISQYVGDLNYAQIAITASGKIDNDENGLAANELNPGTDTFVTINVGDTTYPGASSGSKISEYEQSKEISIKITKMPDENGTLRDLDYSKDKETLSRWGYVIFQENGKWVAYYIGSLTVSYKGSSETKIVSISQYDTRDIYNDGTKGGLWFMMEGSNSLESFTLNGLVGGAHYEIRVRQRFTNGSVSRIAVCAFDAGADKVNNPWGTTLLTADNKAYKNEVWAQELVDIYIRDAFFTYSERYSDKLFLMTGGIIRIGADYYTALPLSGPNAVDYTKYHVVGNPNQKLGADFTIGATNNIKLLLGNDLMTNVPDSQKTYYTDGIAIGIAKEAKTSKYLGNSSFIKALNIPDKFRYRYYNDGQKPTQVLLKVKDKNGYFGSTNMNLVFESDYTSEDSERYVVAYNASRNAYVVNLYSEGAQKVGLTQKYLRYIDQYGKVITKEDLVPGKFDVTNDLILDRNLWNIYLDGADAKTHLDTEIYFDAKFDVSASYECLYLDLSTVLNNSQFANNIIDNYSFNYSESLDGVTYGFVDQEGARYDIRSEYNKLIGHGYDVNIGYAEMKYGDGSSAYFSDKLGNRVVNGHYTNEVTISIIVSSDKAAVAEELQAAPIGSLRVRKIVPYTAKDGVSVHYYLCEIDADGKVIGILKS